MGIPLLQLQKGEEVNFVIDLTGTLRLAPRRSEHVACAGGGPVLSAGEIVFRRERGGWTVGEVSNQSTGYCPDVAGRRSATPSTARGSGIPTASPTRWSSAVARPVRNGTSSATTTSTAPSATPNSPHSGTWTRAADRPGRAVGSWKRRPCEMLGKGPVGARETPQGIAERTGRSESSAEYSLRPYRGAPVSCRRLRGSRARRRSVHRA